MRTISTSLTFVQKVLSPIFFPLIWVVFWWLGYWSNYTQIFGLFAITAFIGSVGWYYLVGWSTKIVRIDDNNLYVSNFRREITIPIADIESVSDLVFSEPRRVTIKLRRPSEFGSTIVFLAKYRWYSGLDALPIVDELNRLAAGKRNEFYPSMLNLP